MLLLQKPLSDLLKFCWCGLKSKCQTLLLSTSGQAVECSLTSSPCWEIPVSACSSWLLVVCHRLGWSRTDSLAIPRMMSLGVVLKVERVPPFIVWGIFRRGSNTPIGFSTSFLPVLIGFSSDLWVFALLVDHLARRHGRSFFEARAPLLERPRCHHGFGTPRAGSTVVFLWLTENFECFLRSGPLRVYAEDWSPEWSFMGETRYLNSLLDTPYLARISWVPRYLTTRGDSAYRLSPFLSWGMMLLWDKPAGARKFSTGPWP
ncbi:hypothetical protein F2Q69_00044248 [Brassica cretica]|uniref:Uncharacterized protein n=1 Tax=Brassica cretica TaxID=69181 RepID=A0A8S9NJ41_BRACR|nr:hypothetical protein F2Q69_00044248 [Brassica cretica]